MNSREHAPQGENTRAPAGLQTYAEPGLDPVAFTMLVESFLRLDAIELSKEDDGRIHVKCRLPGKSEYDFHREYVRPHNLHRALRRCVELSDEAEQEQARQGEETDGAVAKLQALAGQEGGHA